ncbi:type II toxin-antitoxin system RelE/ParE family toxin [Lacipirellula sp.]|uniref:type II toxin-antitoxin system RelE/ParE family toxin n=1 Tax=Lacipirellula sp. TaxID=2691419 RepID=UPI003D1478F1
MSRRRHRLRISEDAAADMRSIAAYIGTNRPAAAKRVISKLRETFQELAANPHFGTACSHVGQGMRHFTPNGPARRYVIIFRSLSEELAWKSSRSSMAHAIGWESLLSSPAD